MFAHFGTLCNFLSFFVTVACGFVLDAHLVDVFLEGVIRPGVPWQSSVGEEDLGRRLAGEDGVKRLNVGLLAGVLDYCYPWDLGTL